MVRSKRVFLTALTLLTLVLCPLARAQDEPVVTLELPDEGPGEALGNWLYAELDGFRVRWNVLDVGGEQLEPVVAVTRSEPGRAGREVRAMRDLLREGGGIIYVVGPGDRNLRAARDFWGPTDVNLESADGGASSARWVEHPLTDALERIGAVTPEVNISGVGGSPLVRAGADTVAVAFDWGPLGRAVIIDEALLFDQLSTLSPRPSVRGLLVRAVNWASGREETTPAVQAPAAAPVGADDGERRDVAAPEHMVAALDLPTEGDEWPALRGALLEALKKAGLEIDELRAEEGEPVITPAGLQRAGLLVVGSGREEVHYTEPIAVARFLDSGGRMLFVSHARGPRQKRMIGFNQLLSQLRIAVALGRKGGQPELVPHPITGGLQATGEERVLDGAQIWTPAVDPMVRVRNRPVAATYQRGEGRLVIIDGELLLRHPRAERPWPVFREMLDRSIEWLLGEL